MTVTSLVSASGTLTVAPLSPDPDPTDTTLPPGGAVMVKLPSEVSLTDVCESVAVTLMRAWLVGVLGTDQLKLPLLLSPLATDWKLLPPFVEYSMPMVRVPVPPLAAQVTACVVPAWYDSPPLGARTVTVGLPPPPVIEICPAVFVTFSACPLSSESTDAVGVRAEDDPPAPFAWNSICATVPDPAVRKALDVE
ncbi:MAG: hypothetical protein R3E12_07425 [Candidatus Eisenbacteria bacterium]